jgi:HK97 gp10 family phage protein
MANPIPVSIDLLGDKELMRKLDKLSSKIGRSVLRKAVRAGTPDVLKDARSRVPKDTGNLKKSMGRKFKWYNRTGTYVVVVGPRHRAEKTTVQRGSFTKTKTAKAIKGFHGHLVEYGTKPRYTKNGVFRGIGPAQPFMRPAWDANRKKAEQLAVAKLLAEVEKEAKRGG